MATLWRRLRGRRRVRLALLGAAIVGYGVVSLSPFEWSPPRLVENGAVWSERAGLTLPVEGLVVGREPPAWLIEAARGHELSIDLRFRPATTAQWGHVLAIGSHGRRQNLSISQKNRHLMLRLRRTCRHVDAVDLPCTTGRMFRRVLEPGRAIDLRLGVRPGRLTLALDGATVLERALPAAPLAVWDQSQRLALGNDPTGSWPWLGEIERAVVRTARLEVDLLEPDLYRMPRRYWAFDREPRLVPFRDAPIKDMLHNAVMYVPLGGLLALLAVRSRWRGVLQALLFTGLVSLTMETAQLFLSDREPSVTDLLLNAAGGAFGFALIVALRTDPRIGRLAARICHRRLRPGAQEG